MGRISEVSRVYAGRVGDNQRGNFFQLGVKTHFFGFEFVHRFSLEAQEYRECKTDSTGPLSTYTRSSGCAMEFPLTRPGVPGPPLPQSWQGLEVSGRRYGGVPHE